VTADVAREAADDVIDRLHALGIQREGALHIEPVRAWLSRGGYEADRRTPGSGADSVVWTDVTQHAYEDSELNWTYVSFMTLATMIAAVAIVLDSQILVIGAMVLGPEFGAVAALGVALVRHRAALFGLASRTLVGGFAIAIVVTTVLVLGAKGLGWVTLAQVTGPRPGTDFIYFPSKWSLIVAVIAAAAGVLSLTSARDRGPVGSVHLRHHGARGREHRPGPGVRRTRRGLGKCPAAAGQPPGDGRRRVGDPGPAADGVGPDVSQTSAADPAHPTRTGARAGRVTAVCREIRMP